MRAAAESAILTAVATLFIFIVAGVVTYEASLVRAAFAFLIFANLALISFRWPTTGVVLTIGFLLVMPLLRRMLIGSAGWSSYDPLLLVGPGIVILLLVKGLLLDRLAPTRDPLLVAVGILLFLMLLGTMNPLSGDVAAGFAGLLFLAVPLLWFAVGRLFGGERGVTAILGVVFFFGVASALYGLAQTSVGFPTWDEAWISVTHFASLNVGGEIRAFGMSASPVEYVHIMLAAIAIAIAYGIEGQKSAYLLALPVLVAAVWLSSVRHAVVLGLFMVIAILVVRARRLSSAYKVGIAAVVVVIGLAYALNSQLSQLSQSGNALVAHQASGLADPLDPTASTLPVHFDLFIGGIETGLRNPLGLGTSSTNLADTRVGTGQQGGTDIDISDVFVSVGALGGIVYSFLVAGTLLAVTRRYRQTRKVLYMAVLGILVSNLFGWLHGGQYGMSAALWFLAGWATLPHSSEGQPDSR